MLRVKNLLLNGQLTKLQKKLQQLSNAKWMSYHYQAPDGIYLHTHKIYSV
jgi:hypothetical protein